MSHPDDGQLHALVDGELSAAEAAELEAHFQTCAECRHRMDEARALLGVSDRIVSALDLPPRAVAPGARRPRFDPRLLGLAASAMLVVTVGWLVLGRSPDVAGMRADSEATPVIEPTVGAAPSRDAGPAAKDERVAQAPPAIAAPAPHGANEPSRRAGAANEAPREERKTEMTRESDGRIAASAEALQKQAMRADTPPQGAAQGTPLNDLPPWKAKVAAPAAAPPAETRFRLEGLDVVSHAVLPGGGTRLVYSVNGTPVEFDQVPASAPATPSAGGDAHELTWSRDDLRLTLRSRLAASELEKLRQLVRE